METCFASSFLLNGRRFKTIRNQIILILKLTPQILRGETWFAASLLLNGMRSKTSRNQIILILKLTPKILRGETCFAYSFLKTNLQNRKRIAGRGNRKTNLTQNRIA
jgi:hypothetical protein